MIDKSITRPALRYHGGKWRLAYWIVSHFPDHGMYVEPYAGAASVLIRKKRVGGEVLNDMNGAVVNFFTVLRDAEQSEQLRVLLAATPFARDEFNAAYEATDDPIEAARRLAVRSFMGFSSDAATRDVKTGFRSACSESRGTPANDWATYADATRTLTERLAGVLIENREATRVMSQFDDPNTLFYLDPPYPKSTRTSNGKNYTHEMSDDDHREMAAVARNLTGMVIVSGYTCPLYEELFGDWAISTRETNANGQNGPVRRQEVLWINPAAEKRRRSQKSLFDRPAA